MSISVVTLYRTCDATGCSHATSASPQDNRIAVCFQYEHHDHKGQWFRAYGNEVSLRVCEYGIVNAHVPGFSPAKGHDRSAKLAR